MVDTPGKERYNNSGKGNFKLTPDVQPQRSDGTPAISEASIAANDRELQQRAHAQMAQNPPDTAGARASVESIIDPGTRVTTFREVFNAGSALEPPGTVYIEGITGISDPLALFFLMVFYLDSYSPTFNWGDVLKAAKASAGGGTTANFDTLAVDDTFLPQARYDFNHPQPGNDPKVDQLNQDAIARNKELEATHREEAARVKAVRDQKQAETDAAKGKLPSNSQSSKVGVNSVVIWPTQNMPKIRDVTKSVTFQENESATTFAEPILSTNQGGSHINLDIEFCYAVGIPGMGDGEVADAPLGGENVKLAWTPEDVLGVMYLAESLVFPFQSNNISGNAKDDKALNPAGAQYPVLFLRHYSLFPFLTPFVVTCVRIEPDEEQPLIITQRDRVNSVNTHLAFPAVRQVVKIVLSLKSAHYYLPFLGGKDPDHQMQLQTSGKTYLQIATGLLGGRI